LSKNLESHIGSLTLGTDVAPDPATENQGEGTFDHGDTLIEAIPEQEAVPHDVVDEQAEIFEKSSRHSEPEADEPEQEKDWRKRYEEAQAAADGRLGEIGNLRNKLNETNQSIEQLRQIFLKKEQEEYEAQQEAEVAAQLEYEREVYGDEVVDDPAVAYMRDKWVQTQEAIERQAQEAEGRRRALLEQSAAHRAQQEQWQAEVAAVGAQEKEFSEKQPDYYDAYEFAKNARMEMYTSVGWSPEQAKEIVANEEAGLRQVQLRNPNGNVARAIYDMATRLGYQPPEPDGKETKPLPTRDTTPNFGKMRAGVSSRGAGDLKGSGGTSGSGRRLSAEEFYNTVPIAERLEIQANPDKFEELGRTGYITLD
jgi:hypothetical protein